jgi:hypothetical protein
MKTHHWKKAGLVVLISLMAGCRLLTFTTVAVVSVVGLAGYAVYKTGEVAVTGVGKAAEATGNAFSSGSKPASTVVFRDGEFRTEYAAGIAPVWLASSAALRKADLQNVDGSRDGISGELRAQTWEGTEIKLKVQNLEPDRTEVRIRVGAKGSLKDSEVIHKLIQTELTGGGAS